MSKLKNPAILLSALILTLLLTRGVNAQVSGNMVTFRRSEIAGISLRVDASNETVPGGNLVLEVWINCTAVGVKVDDFRVSIYGLVGGEEESVLGIFDVVQNSSLSFNVTNWQSYNLTVPANVWGNTQARLDLKYSIFDSPLGNSTNFGVTRVRNVYYERLQDEFRNLNSSYVQLNGTYWQLTGTYQELADSYRQLNETYWDLTRNYNSLMDNYTALQGTLGELGSTRQLAAILGITTVLFVATTLFLIFRRPKEPW